MLIDEVRKTREQIAEVENYIAESKETLKFLKAREKQLLKICTDEELKELENTPETTDTPEEQTTPDVSTDEVGEN